jgi:hypothetical protein
MVDFKGAQHMKAKLIFCVGASEHRTRSAAEKESELVGIPVVTAAECPFCQQTNMDWDSDEFVNHPAQYHIDCWNKATVAGAAVQVDISHTQNMRPIWVPVVQSYYPPGVHADLVGKCQPECKSYLCPIDGKFYRW